MPKPNSIAKPTIKPIAKADPLADVLRPGQSIALLKHLHILTVDGKLHDELRYASLESLQQGIAQDAVDARAWLARA